LDVAAKPARTVDRADFVSDGDFDCLACMRLRRLHLVSDSLARAGAERRLDLAFGSHC